jgi:cysteine desulfurase
MKKLVYMDYHATTPVDPEVLETMLPFFSVNFGNASSRQHEFGWVAEEAVEHARMEIAKAIGAEPKEIVFTSGATEANNLAIKGVAESLKSRGNHIITQVTEHKCVLDSCKHLEKMGYEVTFLGVNREGFVDPEALRAAIKPTTSIVSIMYANNEIGTIQPIDQLAAICKERGVLFHTDATQAVGKIPVNVKNSGIDLMSFSAHKMYGPKGVGGLFVRSNIPTKLEIQIDGGGHERGMRSGTLNVPGIVGLGKAVEKSVRLMPEETRRLTAMRDRMIAEFEQQLSPVHLNGPRTNRLPHNVNVAFDFVEGNVLMMSMKDIAVSTGSACSTGNPEPSHVLKALRLPEDQIHGSVRIGLGRFTTDEDVDYVVHSIVSNVKKLRDFSKGFKARSEAQQVAS